MLQQNNPYVELYRNAKQMQVSHPTKSISITIQADRPEGYGESFNHNKNVSLKYTNLPNIILTATHVNTTTAT